MTNIHSNVAEQFEDLPQQHDAGSIGMWIFLSTEVMFFGGIFVAYTIFRILYPAAFAEGSRLLDLPRGTINTAILLTSSFTMASAVHAAGKGRRKNLVVLLLLTMALGIAFLTIKSSEYIQVYEDHHFPGSGFLYAGPHVSEVRLFLWLYFLLTALHALHMIIGIIILGVLVYKSSKGKYSVEYYSPIEFSGLYWHFIDVVWIFLFPLLYLIHQ